VVNRKLGHKPEQIIQRLKERRGQMPQIHSERMYPDDVNAPLERGVNEWKAWCMECGARGNSIRRRRNRSGYTYYQCQQCDSFDIWDD